MKILSKKAKDAINTLKGFDGINRLYWLNAMIELEEITKSEAGYIVLYKLI